MSNFCTKCGKQLWHDNSTTNAEFCKCPIDIKFDIKPIQPIPMLGWMCPRCKTVHSPFRSSCDCSPDTVTVNNYHYNSFNKE